MNKKQKKNLIRIIVTLCLFLAVFITDKIICLDSVISDSKLSWLLPFFCYLPVYLLIAYDVLLRAIKNIANGRVFDENFLMCVATIGAFCIKAFDEGVAVILFYQIGEWFQSYAVGKSRKSISELMDIRPDFAMVLRNNEYVKVSPEEVSVGELIQIKAGERVPLDGVVVSGKSLLDTKALTGETLLRETEENFEIISGAVNITSTLTVKVTKPFYDSTVSKILELVENASAKKSKAENFISKFARFYTPTVVLLALALAVIPSIITKNYSEWIYRALSFLVVSCPCALVVSIPLSFFMGIGAASKYGILVKGSNYLEKFDNANIFVFDKTGTLTKGNFAVVKVYPDSERERVLRLAAMAERESTHPIALSILKEYGKETSGDCVLTSEQGYGIVLEGASRVLCGNERLMQKYNIKYIPQDDVGTLVYVAEDNEYVGCIVISDQPKEESPETIAALNAMHIKTVMLTGDNEKIAAAVAKNLGLTAYKASLLPQDKVSEVEKLLENKREKEVLCFVGDGINDAPVLMRADIGIAMGGIGSDAAIEASDIVLMKDDLRGIPLAKRIARKTMRIVKENIVFAIAVKLIILALSALGITNMWIAVFGDVGVALVAILNAIRINGFHRKRKNDNTEGIESANE